MIHTADLVRAMERAPIVFPPTDEIGEALETAGICPFCLEGAIEAAANNPDEYDAVLMGFLYGWIVARDL